MAGRRGQLNPTATRDQFFNISIKLIPTGELFQIKKVHGDMKIKELKSAAEFSTGIPFHMQRICYLDEGDLMDKTDIRSNDIVPNGILNMDVWNMWRQLVEAVSANDIDWLFKLGVTATTDFKTPNSEYMMPKAKQAWIADRSFTALYIAAHRGHKKLCQKLIDAGADVNGITTLGRSPLHVAAARGHGTVVDLLLERGADIDAVDNSGESALAVASKYGNKDCERHLFLFRWQERAKMMKQQVYHDMFAHQFFDSKFPVWLEVSTDSYQQGGKMPAIREESSHGSSPNGFSQKKRSTHGGRRSRTPAKLTFEEWLHHKTSAEQKKLDIINAEKARKKLEDEDNRRMEEEKEKSYEQWLAEKETRKRPGAPATKPNGANSMVSDSRNVVAGPVGHGSGHTGGSSRPSTEAMIKTIMQRREREQYERHNSHGNHGMNSQDAYNAWLTNKDTVLLEQIRAGKTPLQMMMQGNA